MPELPEVETVVRGLQPRLVGRCMVKVEVRQADVVHRPRGNSAAFVHALTGRRICAVSRRGKYIVFALDKGWLVCHLRMTGKLLFREEGTKAAKHTHVIFMLDDGSLLFYEDARRFGGFDYWEKNPLAEPPLAALGPEPLTEGFNADYFKESTRRRKRPVKSHLLDQSVVAGIGNIYADEILFRAGVRPRKGTQRLSSSECAAIVAATKQVLGEAIAAGGSTIRDYVDTSSRAGHFQNAHQVYGRAGKPCVHCGTILKSVNVGGRSSVYCPHCQKS